MAVTTVYTDPSTGGALDRATNDVLTESIWHGMLSDIKHLAGAKGTNSARVSKSVNQSTTTALYTRVTWDGTITGHDTNTLFSVANASRLTIAEAGVYLIIATVTWAANVNGSRRLLLAVDFADQFASVGSFANNASLPSGLTTGAILRLGQGQYVEAFAYQDSGGNLDLVAADTHFQVIRVGEWT